MNMKLFKQAMEVGALFWEKYQNDERVYEWNGSEECSLFCKSIIDKAIMLNCNIEESFNLKAEELVNEINHIETTLACHMWDEICKGFLAGEILGKPIKENLQKVKEAEKLWEDIDTYGYYQEVLNEVI